jgi:hypothetical protein
MAEGYSDEEVHRLGAARAAGRPLVCPRCDVALDRRAVPPRSDVSYVRDRLWLVCPRCHRTVVLDSREDG